MAIRVLSQIRRGGIDAHLMVVGQVAFSGKQVRYDNNAYLEHLKHLAEELGETDAVHFTGQRDDVPAVLAALDLSLLPSWDEPFGLATVESMAMGTPPLVSDTGAGPELVKDNVSGRVLPCRKPEAWAAAAGALLRDRAALERMSAHARTAAAQYRDDTQAHQMVAVYEDAIRDSMPRRTRPARWRLDHSLHHSS